MLNLHYSHCVKFFIYKKILYNEHFGADLLQNSFDCIKRRKKMYRFSILIIITLRKKL
jgi:hypothetical protein